MCTNHQQPLPVFTSALLVLPVLLAGACTFEVGSVDLHLVYTSDTSRYPLDPARVRLLKVTVSGPDMNPIVSELRPAATGGSLSGVPVGPNRQVLVEAIGNVGEVVSWGVSEPFSAQSGTTSLFVFMGIAGQFSPPPAGLGLTDPKWSSRFRTSMTHWRIFHAATRLADGRILISGGANGPGPGDFSAPLVTPALRSLDMFWPYAGALFNSTPSADCAAGLWCLHAGRAWHNAVLLEDGHFVLLTGGEPPDQQWPQEVFQISDSTMGWTSPMQRPCYRAATALLPGQGVVVAGGVDSVSGELSADLEVYNEGSFSRWPNVLSQARAGAVALTITDPQPAVVIVGGWRVFGPADGWQASDVIDLVSFDESGIQVTSRHLAHPRADHSIVAIPVQGRMQVLICGGRSSPQTIEPSCELFDPGSGSVAQTAVEVARWHHTATVLTDGRVLVAGGFSGTAYPLLASPKALLLDFPRGRLELPLVNPRAGHSATLMDNGMVLLLGGVSEVAADGTVRFADNDYEIFVPRRPGKNLSGGN